MRNSVKAKAKSILKPTVGFFCLYEAVSFHIQVSWFSCLIALRMSLCNEWLAKKSGWRWPEDIWKNIQHFWGKNHLRNVTLDSFDFLDCIIITAAQSAMSTSYFRLESVRKTFKLSYSRTKVEWQNRIKTHHFDFYPLNVSSSMQVIN